MAAIVDIYCLRRLIEYDALLNASTFHPAIKSMTRACERRDDRYEDKSQMPFGSISIDNHRSDGEQ